MRSAAAAVAASLVLVALVVRPARGGDNNRVFSPCADTTIQRKDGFTFGIAFANRDSFFYNSNTRLQLSPCDSRLSLASSGAAQLVLFRPKVDEISLLTVNTTTNPSVTSGGYMVAFAGRKYAARSQPIFVSNSSYSVTSFTLVLEFKKGTLQNLYWKKDGCGSCSTNSSPFVCVNDACAVRTSTCQNQGVSVDCSIGIQLAFSGTDKHDAVLNSWYEASKLQQYSLYKLYSNLRSSLSSQFDKFF